MPSYIATFIGSGGTVLKTPTADGTSGQFIQTDGSGQLSFADAGGSVDEAADFTWTGSHLFQNNIQLSDGGIIGVLGGETLKIGKITGGGNASLQVDANTTWAKELIMNNGEGLVFGSASGSNKIQANTSEDFAFTKTGGGFATYRFSGSVSDVIFNNIGGVGIGPDINASLSRLHIHDGDFTQSEDSSTSIREVFTRVTSWVDSTDATRKGRADFNVYDTAAREFMSAEASGTAAKLSFFGVAPVTRPQVTAAGVSAADLLTALDSLGILESV